MSNTTALEDALQKLLVYYGAHYEIRHNFAVGEHVVPVLAEFHLTEEKTLFGFKSSGLKMRSTEANEYVLFLLEDRVVSDSMEGLFQLIKAAETELLKIHDDHAYSFFSLVVLAHSVDKEAVAKLKKYKARKTYATGWGMIRMALVDVGSLTAYANRDGKELGRLVVTELKK